MLIAGMFFFWVAVVSGVFGSVDIVGAHHQALHIVFYASLMLATLTFTLRLMRPEVTHDAADDAVRAHAAAPAGLAESHGEEAPAGDPAPDSTGRALVIAGPLVGTR